MKKLIAIMLVLTLVFALASCGKKADELTDKEDEVITDAVTDETEETEEGEATDDEQSESGDDKTEPKPEQKPEQKPEPKPEEKPEAKPEEKPESKPEEQPQTSNTVAGTLLAQFNKIGASGSALSVAEALTQNAILKDVNVMALEVEPGYLNGFDNAEIKGFSEGAMFAPMIGTIPFVGYIFTLDGSISASDFVANLKSNANLRWNICTKADEMVAGIAGNKVFFVMSPKSFEEE